MNKLTFTDSYLSQFKLTRPTSLFPPEKEDIIKALKQKSCPLCGRRLYQTRDQKIWRCRSKAGDKFIIRNEVLNKYE